MATVDKIVRSETRSILRYPGSKARLARFIAQTIVFNGVQNSIFVEPFCGGSSVSIALLEADVVDEIILNDVDPLVASLWKCVFSKKHSKWLAERVLSVPLTLEYWEYQKRLNPTNVREMALKCLYLNRTSFSGVLHSSAGPIGGRTQSKWTVGCRFNREKLSARIIELAKLSHRVKATTSQSWLSVCKKWSADRRSIFYLDPPFYHKAKRLYRFVFDTKAHNKLHDYLMSFDSPWILSYDNASEIRALYNNSKLNARMIDNTYSAHPMGGNSFIGSEVLYSNFMIFPLPVNELMEHVGLSVRTLDELNVSDYTPTKMPIYAAR